MCATCPAHLILLDFIARTILGEKYWSFRTKGNIKMYSMYIKTSECTDTCKVHDDWDVMMRRARTSTSLAVKKKKEVKWSLYKPGVAQRVGRGIALIFHDCGTRRGWVVSSTPRSHFTPGKDPVPILQEGGWVGPRAGLDGRKISSPPGFDPGPSSP